MTSFVIDASVAIKLVVEEPDSSLAVAIAERASLAAPELLFAECANILWKKVQRGGLRADEAKAAANILAELDIELVSLRLLIVPATLIALELDHAAYDCAYLALAIERNCLFVTADERFVRKVRASRNEKLVFRVRTLRETAGTI